MIKTEPLENLVELLEKEYECSKQEAYEGARSLVGFMELLVEINDRNKSLEDKKCGD